MKALFPLSLILFIILANNTFGDQSSVTTAFKFEHLVNPIGIDAPNPRLSWMMDDNRPGARQTAYRVLVGEDSTALNKTLMWDSGKIISAQNMI